MKKKVIITALSIAAIIALRLFLAAAYVPTILMYHSMDADNEHNKLRTDPSDFARQMEFLRKGKYRVISLGEMADLIKNKKKIPPRTLSITFDDGFMNNYVHAFPVLKKYGMPATIFVVTDFIDKKGYLGSDQLREMSRHNITIGSHTRSHKWLPGLRGEKLKDELEGSKMIIERIIGKEVDFVSYPQGAYDERVKEAVREAGYKAACATNPGRASKWDDIYALKRQRVSPTSGNLFIFRIVTSGYNTFIKETRDD